MLPKVNRRGLTALILLSAIGLSACDLSSPVTGMIGDEPAQGEATPKMSGVGSFFTSTADGLTCTGTYDAYDNSATITARTTCNDGRTGNLIITRDKSRLSGTVIGKLSDGTPARFVFGNLSFGQAFGGGGMAQTNPL